MPALPPAAQCVLVRIKGTTGGQIFNNVLHLQYTGPAPGVADLQSIGNSIGSAWTSSFAPLHLAGTLVTGVDLADLTNQSAASASVTLNIPGTRPGSAMPAQACCVVSWNINRRYRGGHPRSYFPFGAIADMQSNHTWTSAFQAAVNAGATSFRTALNALSVSGTTYKMVAISYVLDNNPRTSPIPFTVQSNTTHGRIDTQRRRLGKETP